MERNTSSTSPDSGPVSGLVQRWERAWNRHDMDDAASLVAPDVDFVNVAGLWLKGREEFLSWHRALHAMQMRRSVWTTLGSQARALHEGAWLAHVEWAIAGDLDLDGAPRQPRRGHFMWVVRNGVEPHILAAQNTNLLARVAHRLNGGAHAPGECHAGTLLDPPSRLFSDANGGHK